MTLDWPVLIAVVDQRGSIIFASPSYQSLLGSHPADLIGCSTFALVHPEDVDGLAATYALALREGIARHSFRLCCQDNSYHWMEMSALRTIDTTGQTLLILVAQDVTERRALESQLLQMQKLVSVGRLAGGIAHDFNNLLTGIAGMAELSLHMLPPDHPIYGDLVAIRESTTRASTLVDQLLAFVRQREIEPQIFALNDLICEMAGFLQRLLGADIMLVTCASGELSMVQADFVQIQQVVLNLVVNARDAMPQGGQITIETAAVTLDATSDRDGGGYVMLRVSDTGTGMSPEVQACMFEPFFTTKEPGKGTGLGLATSSRIVKQYGGTIQVHSGPDRGTTIEVYLPSVLSSDLVYQEAAPGNLPCGTETVLLVEHEASVREMVARVLCEQGYNVLEATDGRMHCSWPARIAE